MDTGLRTRFAIVLVIVTVWPAAAAAQAIRVTLGQAVDEIRAALRLVNPSFKDEEPELASDLDGALQALEASGTLDAPLEPLFEATGIDFLSRGRRRQATFNFLASSSLRALWDTVRTARNRNQGAGNLPASEPRGIVRRLRDDYSMDDAAIANMFRAYNRVDDLLQQVALRETMDRLGRYERKFGPGSVHLNGIEVGIAYLVQGIKGFGYSVDDGPGPWEVVASYTTTYFSYTEDEAQIVSASEFGLRHYNFGETWGRGGLRGYLKPAHLSFGLVVAGERNGPLVWPWSGKSRTGAFFAWGDVKVAYIHGVSPTWLFARQFQILPLTF